MGARISGTGAYLPEKIVGNEAFSDPARFRLRKGSVERRHAAPHETSVHMGSCAGARALQAAGVEPEQIDLLLCFSGMPDYQYPKDANLLLAELGLHRAVAWSIDTACASFVTALSCAHALIDSGRHERILIVMVMHWIGRGIDPDSDFSSLGDGAAAVVVERAPRASLVGVLERADPGAFDFVRLRSPFASGTPETFEFSHDPRYREYFGATVLEPVHALLQREGIEAGQIDWLVAHQVGHSLQKVWCRGLGIDPARNLDTFSTTGNMSAVNIPMILDRFVRAPEDASTTGASSPVIARDDLLLLFAPGAGMHIAAMLWRY